MASSDDHAHATPDAHDPAPSVTKLCEHLASADATQRSSAASPHFADGDVVSDEDEILHLAAALEASTTNATATVPAQSTRLSLMISEHGTIADHVRLAGPSDKRRAKLTKYWDDASSGSDESDDSECSDERNEREHPSAPVANGKRRRTGTHTKRYWRQKPVPMHKWHKRQIPLGSGLESNIAGKTIDADGNGATTGRTTGPTEARVKHIFLRRVVKPELRNAVVASVQDADCAPNKSAPFDPPRCEERTDTQSDSGGNSSSNGSEAPLVADATEANAGGAGIRPLRKLTGKWRGKSRMPLFTGSKCTATVCTTAGCDRRPHTQYMNRRTKALSEVCCVHCDYGLRDVDDVKMHTSECDKRQSEHDGEVDTASKLTACARRTDDATAVWPQPSEWADRRPCVPNRWQNRHLTDTEQSTTSSFPEVTGDGATNMEEAEIVGAFRLLLRPFDLDDIDRLRVHPTMVDALNDFLVHAVHRMVNASDALYDDQLETDEIELDIARCSEMLQVAIIIQKGKGGLNLLKRYGYEGPWADHDPGTSTTDPFLALLEVGVLPGPDIIEDTCAQLYIGRTVIPTTDAQAHAAGLTTETAENLSSYLRSRAEEFVRTADAALVHPSPETDAEKRRAFQQLHDCIAVQEGTLHYTALASYAYHDDDGTQHFWFVPHEHEDDRHLSATEQGTTAAYPEVTGDGAASESSLGTTDETVRFVREQQERERARAGVTTEGTEALHHFMGESLLCATHAQAEYHRRPCEATATALEEARSMVSDGINVHFGTVSPATLLPYTRSDDGIYGSPTGSEHVFTREMLNMPPLGTVDDRAARTVATPEFLAQQKARRETEAAAKPPCIHATDDLSADAPVHAIEAAILTEHPTSSQTTDHNARTDSTPANTESDVADPRTERRRPSSAAQSTTAAFEPTGDDAARTRLDDVDLDTLVTVRQARSIGIAPPTTAKLSAFLQWVLDHHAAAVARRADEPNDAHGTEHHDFRALAMTALDVANGRMPLWALGRYVNPLCGTTEQLFDEAEVARAQPHFRSTEPTYLFHSESPPPDLSSLDANFTTQQARLIGITMDTAAKLSAYINDVDERLASATETDKTEGSDTAEALRLSLRHREAAVKVACGQTPLATLASLRYLEGRGPRVFNKAEIALARTLSIIRHPVPPPASVPRAGGNPRRTASGGSFGGTEDTDARGTGHETNPTGASQGTVEGSGLLPHARDFLPRNRHLTDREQGTSKDHPEVKGDGASAGLPTGLQYIATAVDWCYSAVRSGLTPLLAERDHRTAAADQRTENENHGNGQVRLEVEPCGDDTGASSHAPTNVRTIAENLGATVGTLALQTGKRPAEPSPLALSELMPVANPARVGDLVAARQASFSHEWHRAWILRVATSRNRVLHTVQWEDGTTTPDVPLSRIRSFKTPDGPPNADTEIAGLPPPPTAGAPARNGETRATDPDPGDAVYHGFDEASFLTSLPDGGLRVTGAPSIYALPPPDGGTWHPLVHELAPVVMDALSRLELLFNAKRHRTGVAPWAVHMAWHGVWHGGHWDKVVPSKRTQEEVDRRSKAMKRRVQRIRERRSDSPTYDDYRHAPDLYHAAVALLIERGHVSPMTMRRDVRGTASQAATKRTSSMFDVHWLWRLQYTPLWESPDERNTDTIEPQSGLQATKCIKLLDRLRFEGTDAFAPSGRITYRSLASIRTAMGHEAWGGKTAGKSETDPEAGGGGTEGQRLIVYMTEVAAFRVHIDEYPPECELDLITHGSDALPDGAGGLTLRQRATIALLRDGAQRHVPRPQLEHKPLCQLSYLHASYTTDADWGLGEPMTYVSKVPDPSARVSLSVRQTLGRIEQPESTLMTHHDDVKRALATPEYAACGSSGCGEGHALAEKSTWCLVRMQPGKHALVQHGKCGTHSLCPTLVYPPKNSPDYGCHHYTIGNKRTAPNTHSEMRNFLGPLAIAALIVAAFADADLETWENMVVLSFAAGSGSVEHACSMIGVRCYSFDLRKLVSTFGSQHTNNFLDLTEAIYDIVRRTLRSDRRHMLQVSATFADLCCTTEGGLQAKKHRVIVSGTRREKALDPAHGKPKPGEEGAQAADLDSQVHNVLKFFARMQAERNEAHARTDRRPGNPIGASDAHSEPTLHTEPPTEPIVTAQRTGGVLPIESATDPALNRHSTSINLPTTGAGVTGCRDPG